ncbi:hypothetical protein [Pontiella sulfatireligans]|uniref:Uncharacterized protein n=1 Tax=Pontiella sulfatireligans TaxID=2750658 RepID=A0A6C2UDJ5_9BACT|nr:hypothetical protein [Pontiella sulfatireligans]VGO18230.1 hypothetical protein SCARR_00281 [Pontiella sulfatireligans]
MTNTIAQVTNAIVNEPLNSSSLITQYGSGIITSVLTAAILGAGAIFWRYFGHPALTLRIKHRDENKRRDALIKSFNQLVCSGGIDCIKQKHFVAIELPNQTSQPVVVRSVRLVEDGRPVYGLWHDPNHHGLSRDRTEIVKTGVRIAPRSHGTWYFTGPEFTSEQCPDIRYCQIDFEYFLDDQDIYVHSMRSPEDKGDTIFTMFKMWWKAVGEDIKKKKKQPTRS